MEIRCFVLDTLSGRSLLDPHGSLDGWVNLA